jgi:hypothetical protein
LRFVVENLWHITIDRDSKALPELRRSERGIRRSFQRFIDHPVRMNRRPEESRRNARHCSRTNSVVALTRHGRGGSDADRLVIAAQTIAHAPHQHSDVGTLAATVGVKLVEDEEIEPIGVRNDSAIKRALPGHQELEHHEVREQNVRL